MHHQQSQFSLRPVADPSRSPSSHSASITPPMHHRDHHHHHHHHSPEAAYLAPIHQHALGPSGSGQSLRPISPSNLPQPEPHPPNQPPIHRNYPPPPTGHELMRLFPPPPPSNYPMLKGGRSSTSDYFRQQEHAFFAQAGKEIIRIRVDSDFPAGGGGKGKEPMTAPWTAAGAMPSGLVQVAPLPMQKGSPPAPTPMPVPRHDIPHHYEHEPVHSHQTPHQHHQQPMHAPPMQHHAASYHGHPDMHPQHQHQHQHQHVPPPPPSRTASMGGSPPTPHYVHMTQQQQVPPPPAPVNVGISVEEWRAPVPGMQPPGESRRRAGKHTKRVVR